MAKTLKRLRPVIDNRMCKRCDICVTFCPKRVFSKRASESPLVSDPESCIACELCVVQCPDFAIKLVDRGGDARDG